MMRINVIQKLFYKIRSHQKEAKNARQSLKKRVKHHKFGQKITRLQPEYS